MKLREYENFSVKLITVIEICECILFTSFTAIKNPEHNAGQQIFNSCNHQRTKHTILDGFFALISVTLLALLTLGLNTVNFPKWR